MRLALVFVAVFLAGPLMFWALARRSPTGAYFLMLWLGMTAMVAGAFALNAYILPMAAEPLVTGLQIIALLWLAWIVMLAICVLAIRSSRVGPRTKRWTAAIGAMATTLPWFGLYAAQVVTD